MKKQSLLIVQVAKGFVVLQLEKLPEGLALDDLRAFSSIEDSRSYAGDGVVTFIKDHFTAEPEAS